jgi:hypothetical protein
VLAGVVAPGGHLVVSEDDDGGTDTWPPLLVDNYG